ncbi:hypothetical protein BY996DRAFT_8392364 [Phakopsora pachyrhizi]|nr:hypothetical protein BY996DRAFT_8392364 [Phakopsora pachyrhizi]
MTRPTETTRRRLPKLHVGRKPGDRIGIAGGGRSAVFAKPGGRIERIGVRVGPVGLEVALERRQVIGGLGGAIKKDHDEGDQTGTRNAALDQFFDLKFKNIEQWIDELRELTRKLELAGAKIDSDIMSRLAVQILPSKYETLMTVLTLKDRYPTIEEIINSVEPSHVQFGKSNIKDEVSMNAKVYHRKNPGKCHNCGKPGHWANECRSKKDKGKPRDKITG